MKQWYKVNEGEKIQYVDVISLYPYIYKYGKAPTGHPKLYWVKPAPLTT
jgi:hypothetical protein